MTKLVAVWHIGRVGSTVVGDCLNQNKCISWHNEIFNDYMPSRRRRGESIATVGSVLQKHKSKCDKDYCIFDIKYLSCQHLSIYGASQMQMLKMLREDRVYDHVIIHRNNSLKRMLSHCIAMETKVYHRKDGTLLETNTNKLIINIQSIKVGTAWNSLVDWLEIIELEESKLKQAMKEMSQGYEYIVYEKDIERGPVTAYRKICNHLSVEYGEVEVSYQKNNHSYGECIKNYREVEEEIMKSRFKWMLEG